MIKPRTMGLFLLVMLGVATGAMGQDQDVPKPRPGLTATQTRQAIRIAGEALAESRPKGENPPAPKPAAKRREYVVAVERLAEKSPRNEANPPGGEGATGRAVVTTYRYEDDSTTYSVVDLASGQVVDTQTARHMRTPLSDGEYKYAQDLAVERVAEVRDLRQKFGPRLETYAQFSQYTPEGDDRVHRVVHILYRVDKRDLSAPRPVVDLTTLTVTVPTPEPAEADPSAPQP